MITTVAIIPAKSRSRRVPDKNFKPFWNGLSLVELKIITLRGAGIDRIILSSDDLSKRSLAERYRIEFQPRPSALCGDSINLKELFTFALRGLQEYLVFWAHPTSPFVTPECIERAIAFGTENPDICVVGVQEMQEFLWKSGRPFNYDPENQPRSQDLEVICRVTGGIHISKGKNFIARGAVTFSPVLFVQLSMIESIDINTQEEWAMAQILAPKVAPSIYS